MSEFTATTVKFEVGQETTGVIQFDQPRFDKFGNVWYALDDDRRFRATQRLHDMIQMLNIKKGDTVTITKYVEEGDDGKKYTPFKVNGKTYKEVTDNGPTQPSQNTPPPTANGGWEKAESSGMNDPHGQLIELQQKFVAWTQAMDQKFAEIKKSLEVSAPSHTNTTSSHPQVTATANPLDDDLPF